MLNLTGPSGMHVSYIWDSSLAKRPRELSFACSLGIPAIPVGSESATNLAHGEESSNLCSQLRVLTNFERKLDG